MDIVGSLPQWATAGIAALALFAAFRSIRSQREIARKRAAMDFFFKVEMDKENLESHKRFTDGVAALKEHVGGEYPIESFQASNHYWIIRNYLNIHELMAVGIEKDVFDDHVCYFFWSGELFRAYEACRPLIEHIQQQPGERFTYVELVAVHDRWNRRKERPSR